jgi:hypothetical protein
MAWHLEIAVMLFLPNPSKVSMPPQVPFGVASAGVTLRLRGKGKSSCIKELNGLALQITRHLPPWEKMAFWYHSQIE